MMGTQDAPAQLLYDFDLDRHVPSDHIPREIDRFLDMDGMREVLRPFYSSPRTSLNRPGLIIRMLVIGYIMGIRSERRLWRDEDKLEIVLSVGIGGATVTQEALRL